MFSLQTQSAAAFSRADLDPQYNVEKAHLQSAKHAVAHSRHAHQTSHPGLAEINESLGNPEAAAQLLKGTSPVNAGLEPATSS